MKKHIPNAITCLNLFSGCIGVLMVLKGDYWMAFYCVIASGIFDFFDGLVARALHVKSAIGKELDSLADVVSFGFLPGTVMYMMLKSATDNEYIPYLGFVITVFSALRLAKFNVDDRQTTDFIGVNTPMNTFFIISLPFLAEQYNAVLTNQYVLLLIAAVVSFLLVSEIKLFSMKLSSLTWQANKYKYIFIGLSVIALISIQFLAFPVILCLYILFSSIHFSQHSAD